jgi:CubicO group peptidase (beta-lactamase class C family)
VFLLGQLLARAAKTPVDAFAKSRLFAPLGIEAVEWVKTPRGLVQTGGGLRMRSRDLLKLAELYRDRGRWRDKPLVPEAWVERSIRSHAHVKPDIDYGYLWWLSRFGKGRSVEAVYMNGNGGNKVLFFPELAMSAVITTTNYNTRGMHEQTDRMVSEHLLAAAGR